MKRIAHLVFLLLIVSGNTVAQDQQRWQFDLLFGEQVVATAAADCMAGGACSASSWVVLSRANFGCDFKLDFSVQFSGTAVRLMLFNKTLDSDCANMILTMATGTGISNANYPTAISAEGEVTITYDSPVGTAGGNATWEARRTR